MPSTTSFQFFSPWQTTKQLPSRKVTCRLLPLTSVRTGRGFAEHQYDYVGNAVANTMISGNGKVGENGTVDLFGWSTVANFFGIHYSENPSLYSGDFIEWGKRIGDGWRTLTKDEWVYVFNTRTGEKASTVAENANIRFAKATVNSVKGMIIFPDSGTFAASEFTTVAALKQTEGGTIAYTKKEECNEIELTATPDEGYEFVKWNDDNTDATRTVAVNSDIEFSATFQVKPTAISQTNQKSKIKNQKVIKDGQLLILHDGKSFNAVGQEVK